MGSVPDESVKPPQQAATGAVGGSTKRVKREDCEFVKHDKVFSEWKILVGPSDWKEHASGKDGAQRFRACNLPTGHVGPGVYELGVTAPAWLPAQGGSRTSFLRPSDVIVVYVGHADNICQRLQRYGQAGAHLEGSRSTRLFFAKNDMASNPQTVENGRMSTDERPTRSLERCSSADTVRMSTDERQTSSARLVNSDERRTSIDEAWINMDFKQMGKDERRDAFDGGRFSTDERRLNLAELMSPGPERERQRERGNRSPRGPRLFSEIFALGCSIAYRWAATDSKLVAERIESQLMLVFDYAWNRGNVAQRSPDILAKIVMGGAPGNKESSTCCFGNGSSSRRWFFFRRKRPGIWIPARRPERIYGDRTNKVGDAFMLLGGRNGAKTSEFTMLDIPVERCGAILDSGLPCSALPVKGRKRCLMHKNEKRRSERKSIRVAHIVQNTPPSQRNSSLPTIAPNPNPNSTTAREPGMFESCFPFLAPSGSKPPVSVPQESKRRGSISFNTWLRTSELRKSKGTEWLAAMDEMNGIGDGIGIRPRHSTEGGKRSVTYQTTLSTWTEAQNEVPATRREICGLRLEDGTVCTVAPRPDRKRCFAHKGMRNSGLRSPIDIQSPNNMPLSSLEEVRSPILR